MKKSIFIFAALFIAIIVHAQKDEYAYLKKNWKSYPTYIDNNPLRKKVVAAKLKGYSETIKKGNKEYLWVKVNYNDSGNYTSMDFYKKNGNLLKQYIYEYSQANKNTSYIVKSKNGKKNLQYNYKYDNNNCVIEEEAFNNGKPEMKITSKFDSLKILESCYYKNGSPEFKRKWVYTYYPDKSRKSSIVYNAKEKILYTWNYECKPEGELATKHKDTTAVCRKENYDSEGNKIVTFQKFNEKGKPYKIEYIYNKDNKFIAYTTYYQNNVIHFKGKYNEHTGETMEYAIYDKKGNESYRMVSTFDDKDNITETKTYNKGKQTSSRINEFSPSNFVSSMKYYRKGKLESSYTYEYIYF
ncbi:MAG TPA: hypothetical protein PKK00_01750 [Bacteroidales bacterium]|nr:hypothetical protein [Bacteroidales bacterium]HPS16179.1 hypothetical protein [Bacteroidales bacterium]